MKATLINDQNCVFDSTESDSLAAIKEWALGRGGSYKLEIATLETIEHFKVEGNKLTHIVFEDNELGSLFEQLDKQYGDK